VAQLVADGATELRFLLLGALSSEADATVAAGRPIPLAYRSDPAKARRYAQYLELCLVNDPTIFGPVFDAVNRYNDAVATLGGGVGVAGGSNAPSAPSPAC
jgi:hypothetical protein